MFRSKNGTASKEKPDYETLDKDIFKKYCLRTEGSKYYPSILPKTSRIIAIGDLHGDWDLTLRVLKLAKLIDSDLNWIGGTSTLVQVGDQIDNCRPLNKKCDEPDDSAYSPYDEPEDLKVFNFLTNLHKSAELSGGSVILLLGNHELMNVEGNMNYVSYNDVVKFKGGDVRVLEPAIGRDVRVLEPAIGRDVRVLEPAIGRDVRVLEPAIGGDNTDKIYLKKLSERQSAFKRGSKYASILACSRLPAVIIGSFIFVHAGFISKFMDEAQITSRDDLYRISYLMKKWLLKLIDKDNILNILQNQHTSMFWDRILGSIPPNMDMSDERCNENLKNALQIFNVNGMVIGHTPQFSKNNGINSTCDDHLWRIDFGGSFSFNKFDQEYLKSSYRTLDRVPQCLEILDDTKINILHE
jgi:hypothetical protein